MSEELWREQVEETLSNLVEVAKSQNDSIVDLTSAANDVLLILKALIKVRAE